MSKKSKRYRNVMLTLYDYDLKHIQPLFDDRKRIKCYAYQEELCPTTKKEHIQAYVEFKNPYTFVGIKKKFGKTVHIEPRKGTKTQAVEYCTKTETRKPDTLPYTHNVRMKGGRRPVLENFVNGYINGTISDQQFRDTYPVYFIANFRKLREQRTEVKDIKIMGQTIRKYSKAILRPWQIQALQQYIAQDDRTILWIYDTRGNTGKTWLAKYILVKFKDVFIVENGKAADILHAYQKQSNVVYDLSRSQEEFINYMTMEQFKNGKAFASKYNSKTIIFTPARVIVFANYQPDYTKLSPDRWLVYKIVKNNLKLKAVVSHPIRVTNKPSYNGPNLKQEEIESLISMTLPDEYYTPK